MWLLEAATLELKWFGDRDVPDYAILSHTWDEEEVTYEDMLEKRYANMKGFENINKCCRQALTDGLAYAWVDTCCIDKRSSAELSEAINSMYRWYQEAKVCYALVTDVEAPTDHDPDATIERKEGGIEVLAGDGPYESYLRHHA
ncbi:hypothetical protein LTR24_001985 [Lithohypha guttulata]|uniref:Heterokaryon incompatibility domain-containing protein n=1 Tax=Lithohypha guttulata TaxID=1690604 RepID=A0ABR0KJR8_9EURO|nr:hypothetical protein LTR24_001985 [Lithohypha guttulata]